MKRLQGFEHGVNLGGWLSQCSHTKERYDSFITESDIRRMAGWKLDHIRLPVDYNLVEDRDGNYIDEGFSYIQKAIDWTRKYKLNMVLDLHKTYGFSFDTGEHESGFFENPKHQERFIKLWEEFARRFASFKDSVAFELLNEVTEKEYCGTWNKVATECIARIRKISPDVKILVGGYYHNNVIALKDIIFPPDENVVYNFHCYEPLVFTHQAAHWIDTMDKSLSLRANEKYGVLKAKSEGNLRQVTAGFKDFPEYAEFTSAYFDKLFSEAVKIAEERNVALYCGEYGVINNASAEDTLAWYRMISSAFEKHGIGRAAWSYKEMDFGLVDAHLDSVRDEIITLL